MFSFCMLLSRLLDLTLLCSLADINENCLREFRNHWNCLENNNHQLYQCRKPERRLNACVFDKIVGLAQVLECISTLIRSQGLTKEIPGTPEGEVPVHLRQKQIYATLPQEEPGYRLWERPFLRLLKGRKEDNIGSSTKDELREAAQKAAGRSNTVKE